MRRYGFGHFDILGDDWPGDDYPQFVPGNMAPTVLCDHDPAYDTEIQRWEDDGGLPS